MTSAQMDSLSLMHASIAVPWAELAVATHLFGTQGGCLMQVARRKRRTWTRMFLLQTCRMKLLLPRRRRRGTSTRARNEGAFIFKMRSPTALRSPSTIGRIHRLAGIHDVSTRDTRRARSAPLSGTLVLPPQGYSAHRHFPCVPARSHRVSVSHGPYLLFW
jgi:hypothetical protein